MIKIQCWTADANDGAGIPRIRSIEALQRRYPCTVQVSNVIAEYNIEWADIVVIHRANTAAHEHLAKVVKALQKKLWIDVDDDQLAVPIDHRAYIEYRDQHAPFIRSITPLADVVTISNPNILKSYQGLSHRFEYYPCAYDDTLMPEPDYSPREKIIAWRGTNVARSVQEFAPAIGRIDKKFKGWKFVFISDYPWQMIDQVTENQWLYQPYLQTQALWKFMRHHKPAIHICPLTGGCQFTRSRSNMAVMDATISGAAVLAPDWEHFRTPGVYTYKQGERNFESLLSGMMRAIENGDDYQENVERSWHHIQEHQTFKAINRKQWEIVKSLMGNQL